MSFPSALQSAVFYFLACTPCMNIRHRQRARQKAERERAAKWRTEMDQPGLYRHPSPFSTNPFWGEEITMGPSLPRKNSSKTASQRRLTSSGKDSTTLSSAGGSLAPIEDVADSVESMSPSTGRASDGPADDWNRKRYQREDEELWGQQWPGHRFVDAIVKAGSSAGRLIEAKLGIDKPPDSPTEPTGRYNFSNVAHHKNPPVNDLHPPVVSSKPAHRDAHRWMLQPPPPAKIMEGKVPVRHTPSSTASKGSLVSPAGEEQPPLDRTLLDRRLEAAARREREKDGEREWSSGSDRDSDRDLEKGEVLPSEEKLIEEIIGRPAPRRTLTGRSRSFSVESSDSWDSEPDRRWPGARPIREFPNAKFFSGGDSVINKERSTDARAGGGADDKENMPPAHIVPQHVARRPKLETIMSSGIFARPAALAVSAKS